MSLNEKEVLKQAKEQPEDFVAWTPDDIINQPLKEAVMAVVLRARPRATVEGVMDLLNDMRVDIYKEKIRELTPRVPVLGKPFVQFKMLDMLCKKLKVKVWELNEGHCPVTTTGPADIVYSTMYLKAWAAEEAETLALMKQMRLEATARKARESPRAVAKLSSLGDLAKSRWAPKSEASAGPAPKDDTGVDCMASGKSSKGISAAEPVLKAGRVDPMAPAACPKGKEKKSVASEEEMRSAWTSIMGSEIVPGWPTWPGSQHDECGTFDIPFPPERDWEACYGRPSQNLWLYMSPAVQVICQVSGEGFRKLVVRLRDQQAATPFNQLELFRSWSGIAAWAHQLARGDQDIPITEFMGRYFRASARDVFTKVVAGEA